MVNIKIFVISLLTRKDRHSRFRDRFGGPFTLWPGVTVDETDIDPSEISTLAWSQEKKPYDYSKYICGTVGCRRAHLGLLQHCLQKHSDGCVLILEDDCTITWQQTQEIIQEISSLPENWWQLYLGGLVFGHTSAVVGTSKFVQVNGVWGTEAVLYSPRGLIAAENSIQRSSCEIDHWMSVDLHGAGNSYIVNPPKRLQDQSLSSIRFKS